MDININLTVHGKKMALNRIILCADKYRIFGGLTATVTLFYFILWLSPGYFCIFTSEKKLFYALRILFG